VYISVILCDMTQPHYVIAFRRFDTKLWSQTFGHQLPNDAAS